MTRRGMTVLLLEPVLLILAMEKEGSRQTLARSSIDRPVAEDTSERRRISSGV